MSQLNSTYSQSDRKKTVQIYWSYKIQATSDFHSRRKEMRNTMLKHRLKRVHEENRVRYIHIHPNAFPELVKGFIAGFGLT